MYNQNYPQIIGQPIQCAFGQPPRLPNIYDFAHLQQYIPAITSTVINVLSSELNSPGRIVVFNNACNNNSWSSECLAAIVELACIILSVNGGRNGMINEQTIYQASDQAVALYVSKEILDNHNLRNMCNNDSLNAASQNVRQLATYLQQMNSGNVPYTGVGNRASMPQQRSIQPQNTQMVQNAISGGNSSLTGANASINRNTQHRNPKPRGQTYNRFGNTEKNDDTQIAMPIPEKVFTKANWRPSGEYAYLFLLNPNKEQEIFTEDGNGNVVQLLGQNEDYIVDRDKHRLMPVLGNNFRLNTETREIRIGASLEKLNSIKEVTLREAIDNTDTPEFESIVNNMYPKLIVDLFLESAIFNGRMHQLEHQGLSGITTYRCFSTIFTPHIVRANCNPIMQSLSKYTNFKGLANAMRETGSLVQVSFNKAESDESRLDNQDIVMFINNIDIMLTKLINNFLRHNLSLSTLRIDSFVSDIDSVIEYLAKNLSNRYLNAFTQFEKQVINNLLMTPDEKTEKDLLELLTYSEIDMACSIGFIPTSYSFTYINMLAKELQLDGVDEYSRLIRQSEYPMLYDLAQSLFKHADAYHATPVYHLLITQDNEIFKLYNGYLSMNSYLISR